MRQRRARHLNQNSPSLEKLRQKPISARAYAHRHWPGAPVTMRDCADNWRTNSEKAGAAIMPVGVVAGLPSVALFVGIRCSLVNDSRRSIDLLRQTLPALGVTAGNTANGCARFGAPSSQQWQVYGLRTGRTPLLE